MRHVLCYKALHLGHVAKSFCIREAPSQLNVLGHSQRFSQPRMKSVRPVKRKLQSVSEFDSGLSLIKSEGKHKKKRTR
ncbi:hypothetical protein TNIN_336561 [Trichonephila inaurata madagascariensis]|uniref:Uncharacterized protein n=1 Tax=Trichonephila inaurata madagascariensis TaxID=2747483 RepID=A0A8X6MH53_9ARAC|nr:hypothetical protein TNIN_336561 [Trichonephila inaurata madagascariensis]